MNIAELRNAASKEWEKIIRPDKVLVFIGMATCGKSAGAQKVMDGIIKALSGKKVDFEIISVGCIGFCHSEPLVDVVRPGCGVRVCFGNVKLKDIQKIVGYILSGKIPKGLAIGKIGEGSLDGIPDLEQIPFMKFQVRRILKRCGIIDPENIYHYIANDGYSGLVKALNRRPEEIIEEVKSSGLRGRGGAGFPTGVKWQTCRDQKGGPKYLICNADEGDPGAFMNRALLEGDPHSVLEGMVIAGFAIGAEEGYIYCRAEYPLALERLRTAISRMEELNLLGANILGSDFSFRIKIKEGAGAFVCGEETALIASLEGKRGMPRSRPPFPAEKGLWDKPTVINNAETLANVSHILQNSAGWFGEYGTPKSKGTKTFCLTGKIKNTGLIEIPLGMSLKRIVYDIGGGIALGKRFKAIQIGGPSGGCLSADLLGLSVDYDSLAEAGAIMGSGGMIIIDEDNCVIDLAKYFLSFTQKESCGKCVPCRVGTKQMLTMLERIAQGKANPDELTGLRELALTVKEASLCGLGQTSANPVLTTLKYFHDDYQSHIIDKKCPAVACKDLVIAACRDTCPAEIDAPRYIRLVNDGMPSEACAVIREKVPFPGVLGRVCYHPCEIKCPRKDLDESISINALKRFAADNDDGLWKSRVKKYSNTGKKVAIIGSGPAGLTAAYFIALKGHKAVVFEAWEKPGGMLSLIPEYRLPKNVLDEEVKDIEDIGVTIKTRTKIVSLEKLFDDGFDAVFVACGLQKNSRLKIEGESEKDVLNSFDFLRQARSRRKPDIGKDVIVVGGGNVAIDSGRTAGKLGSKNVRIIYRRTRKEMPAHPEEIKAALEEKIKISYLLSPKRITRESGKLKLECLRMQLAEVDRSGRRAVVSIPDSEVTFSADTIVVAIGQEIDTDFGIDVKQISKRTLAANMNGVFAGGDFARGPSSAIEAIADGRRAASSIDKYLGGDGLVEQILSFAQGRLDIPQDNQNKKKRIEAECGYTEKEAKLEAGRCLKCDLGKPNR